MAPGIFFICVGLVVLLIAPQCADNIGKKFREFSSEIDPNIFKFALVILGIAVIIMGAVTLTKALR